MPEEFLSQVLSGHPVSAVGWGNGKRLKQVQGLSLVLHSLLILLVLQLSVQKMRDERILPPIGEELHGLIFPGMPPELKPAQKPGRGGGSGGNSDPVASTRGNVPPFRWIQIAPPVLPKNQNPQLAVEPNLLGDPQMRLPQIKAPNWGLPNMKEFTNSDGPGHGGGQGNKCCGGSGLDGDGRGYGPGEEWGVGGGRPRAGTFGTTHPVCLFCPNPNYTDEARKAKFQGIVVLRAIITTDGRATSIRVMKSAGLGLDEQAIQAVQTWQFKPSRGANGQPVEVWQDIEIKFRIY